MYTYALLHNGGGIKLSSVLLFLRPTRIRFAGSQVSKAAGGAGNLSPMTSFVEKFGGAFLQHFKDTTIQCQCSGLFKKNEARSRQGSGEGSADISCLRCFVPVTFRAGEQTYGGLTHVRPPPHRSRSTFAFPYPRPLRSRIHEPLACARSDALLFALPQMVPRPIAQALSIPSLT